MKDIILNGRYKKLELFDEDYLINIINQQSNKKIVFLIKCYGKFGILQLGMKD